MRSSSQNGRTRLNHEAIRNDPSSTEPVICLPSGDSTLRGDLHCGGHLFLHPPGAGARVRVH